MFYYAKARGAPSSFAWLTGIIMIIFIIQRISETNNYLPTILKLMLYVGPGVYCGGLNFDTLQDNNSTVTSQARLLPYVTADGQSSIPPIALALTEFHVLLLYKDR